MQIEKIVKPSFSVIGKQGSTADGAQFVAALWADANAHFAEIAHLAKNMRTAPWPESGAR